MPSAETLKSAAMSRATLPSLSLLTRPEKTFWMIEVIVATSETMAGSKLVGLSVEKVWNTAGGAGFGASGLGDGAGVGVADLLLQPASSARPSTIARSTVSLFRFIW